VTSELEASVSAVVTDDVAPGCAAAVVAGARRYKCVRGRLHRGPDAPPVDDETVWDLASLTKLLSTTALCASAVERGALALEETPWPGWPGVSVEHVLRHSAGLPAWRPLYEEARRRGAVGVGESSRAIVAAALAVQPEAAPGERTLYSDIGFIALGALLEERLGAPLDALFRAQAATYGAKTLGYVRLEQEGFHAALPNVAPTERCAWRRRTMHGQVHDENCFAMGGVSGHAGLFGTLDDVVRAGALLLRAMRGPGLLARWAQADGQPRGIGFDRASKGGSTGDALSDLAVGHLGFTGCSLWIDPVGDGAVYVLLSNRVHETRAHPERILEARRRFHRAAAAWAQTLAAEDR
jgi:CubicO group peptidase (beta-lactamase class C family)